MDETYVKVCGQWKYLYRAVDQDGHTVDFLLRAHRDAAAARRFLERAIDLHGVPEKILVRPMMGFKSFACARILIAGIETMHMIRKGQIEPLREQDSAAADQFYSLAF